MKWPRYSEMLLGAWLVIAPKLLDYGDSTELAAVSIAAGVIVLVLDFIALARIRGYAYLGILVVVVALLGHAYFIAPAESPGTQNHVVVALLLAMFAILPTEATKHPASWRNYHGEQRD